MTHVYWRINTPNLLQEILDGNPSAWILNVPINMLGKLLAEVADRAAELNDPKLNALMLRLALYEAGDPTASGYDPELYDRVVNAAYPPK